MPFLSLKKYIIILSVFFTLLSCHQAPKPEITTSFDVNFEILNGKVKQLREELRKNKQDPPYTYITNFDIHGNATQMDIIGAMLSYEYSYDNTGRKISVTEKNNVDTLHLYEYLYKYDMNGRIVEMSCNTNDLTVHTGAQLRKKHLYVPKKDRVFYKYDATGNRVEDNHYRDQEHEWRKTYKYDEKHLLIEEEYFSGDDKKPTTKATYRYTSFDSKGNWLRRVGEVKDYGPPRQEIPQPVVMRKITYY